MYVHSATETQATVIEIPMEEFKLEDNQEKDDNEKTLHCQFSGIFTGNFNVLLNNNLP